MEEERITGPRLLHQMKKRKKRVAKKARVESPRTPTPEPDLSQVPSSGPEPPQAPISGPELPDAPPVRDLEGDLPPRGPDTVAESIAELAGAATEVSNPTGAAAEVSEGSAHRAADTAASSSGTQEEEESIMNPDISLERSKRAVITTEVNTAVHALTFQSDKHLRRALAAKESSRAAHTELRAARGKIHQLESDATTQKSFIEALLLEKDELAREGDRLKAEVNGLRADDMARQATDDSDSDDEGSNEEADTTELADSPEEAPEEAPSKADKPSK
ncbi:PREDICTED: protein IWS1 homolog [Nelumbo nucifera]|uniref:Protein IWS1 homolog n=1 Tax=Nelumbo nucifera TaxID=4432 RepID=A0A1U8BK78_NELNU|nr:PREDICTED: protein IWS1 homolog [Nelumbo nucifera]